MKGYVSDLDVLEGVFRREHGPFTELTIDQFDDLMDVFAELRASRKVVEAAEAYVTAKEREAELTEPWNAPEIDNGIVRALAELSTLNAISTEGK